VSLLKVHGKNLDPISHSVFAWPSIHKRKIIQNVEKMMKLVTL